jgi:hypothetical protein
MSPTRKVSLVAGLLFIVTFVASIPAAFYFYAPMLDHADYIFGAGADSRVTWGALLEVVLIVANIGTAVVLFPILRRQHEGAALGWVAARIVESTFIAIGVISVLSIVTLRQDVAGATGAASSLALSQTLLAIHDWTFLLGPGLIVGIGNGLLLGYLMYRSGLVPRGMALLGLIGGPLVIASGIAVLFGVYEQTSAASFLLTVPEIAWEASLAVYLTFWGFKAAGLRKLGLAPDAPASTIDSPKELRQVA